MSNSRDNDVNVTFRATRSAELVVEFSVSGPSATTTGSSRLSPAKAQDIALNVLRAQGVVDERARIVAALRRRAEVVTISAAAQELEEMANDIEQGRR